MQSNTEGAQCKVENHAETTFLTDEVGRKYRILDAATGEEKRGTYFVLRLDSDSRDEQIAVRCALDEYVRVHKAAGNCPYANRVAAWVMRLNDGKGGAE